MEKTKKYVPIPPEQPGLFAELAFAPLPITSNSSDNFVIVPATNA
jgi:hypothetical protein